MDVIVVPLHEKPEYMQHCCALLNDEWERSETARLHSLENSSDTLPTCLILLTNKKLIGHLKLSPIPSIKEACFVESVVIDRKLRGKGFGSILMQKAEEYCKNILGLHTVYLSTKGQEQFYSKLGYIECQPISIYGTYTPKSLAPQHIKISNKECTVMKNAPPPPPLPKSSTLKNSLLIKTYMKKNLV